jgi:EAL domain-containing protein (putative c-di-GMP-specific phosphodiesterase class I)
VKGRDDPVDLIWISTNYSSVFFSEKEIKRFLNSLVPKNGITPTGLCIEFLETHLNKKYTRNEIMNAAPDQLKKMIILSQNYFIGKSFNSGNTITIIE